MKHFDELPERVKAKIDRHPGGCWLWTGQIDGCGYGRIQVDDRPREAHRTVFAMLAGPIPAGLSIDHVCHNADVECPGGKQCMHRRCVNPEHLEAISKEENYQRAKQSRRRCRNGHERTPENTGLRVGSKGYVVRVCHTCRRVRSAARRAVATGTP